MRGHAGKGLARALFFVSTGYKKLLLFPCSSL
jgi:hypothetical protein